MSVGSFEHNLHQWILVCKFQLDSNYNILSCIVASKIKIQMLQFNGTVFPGTDETCLEIIIQDNKRKENWLP